MEQAKQCLDYVASHGNAVITYNATDMVLDVHNDAGYYNKPGARSRAGGLFPSKHEKIPPNNGSILNVAQIIKAVISSAAEAERGPLLYVSK